MPNLVLFLDDGGVMSDNRLRGPQWQRLLGEFFPPILGGTPEDWAAANRAAVSGWSDDYVQRLWREANGDYAAFVRLDRLAWLRSMCAFLRMPEPPESTCLELAARAAAYVRPRVRATIPGAVEAIERLHEMGYKLHTASAESSQDLEDYLGAMGVRSCFGRLYGPDLAGTLKIGPEYYARVFADASVAPEQALVVDDRPAAIDWATGVGARAVFIGAQAAVREGQMCLNSLAELPAVIAGLD